MISGTFFGGIITKNISPRIAPLMSSVANIISIIVIIFFIPNDTKSIKTQRIEERLQEALNENTDISGKGTGKTECDSPLTDKEILTSENSERLDDENGAESSSYKQKNEANIGECGSREKKIQDKSCKHLEDLTNQKEDHFDQKDEIYCEKPIESDENKRTTTPNSDPSSSCSDLRKFWRVIRLPNMAIVIGIEVARTFASSLLYNMFSMAVMDFYGLDATVNGILLSFIGVSIMFCQGFLVGFLTKRYKDSFLIKISLSLNVIGFLYLSVASKIYMLVLVLIPLLAGGTLSHITFMVIITKIASDEDTGSALGIIFMLRGAMRAISPSIGGLIFTHIGFPFIGVTGYIIEMILFLIVMFVLKDSQLDLK